MATKAPAYLDEEFAELATSATVAQLQGDGAGRPTGTAQALPVGTEPDESLADVVRRRRPVPPPGRARRRSRSHRRRRADRGPRRAVPGRPDRRHVGRGDRRDGPALARRGTRRAARAVPGQLVHRPDRSGAGAAGPTGWPCPTGCATSCCATAPSGPTFTADGKPVSVGRSQHQVPERTRRLVEQRDRKCRVPWCTQTRWLQVHHVVHDEHDGPTDTWNLIAICPADHRRHHRGQLGITRRRRRPERADVHRRPGPGHRPGDPTGEADGAATRPGRAVRAPARGAARRPGDHVPGSAAGATARSTPRRERSRVHREPRRHPRNVRP